MKAIVKQRGVTFTGFIMVAAVLVSVAIFSMKLIPAYMENGKIQKAFDAIVRDPALQAGTVFEIKEAFYKRANTMDNVTTVTSNDIVISKENGVLTLSASYSAKIPLAGNVSLLVEFNPTASR